MYKIVNSSLTLYTNDEESAVKWCDELGASMRKTTLFEDFIYHSSKGMIFTLGVWVSLASLIIASDMFRFDARTWMISSRILLDIASVIYFVTTIAIWNRKRIKSRHIRS